MDLNNIQKFLGNLKELLRSDPNIIYNIIKLSTNINIDQNLLDQLINDYNSYTVDGLDPIIPDSAIKQLSPHGSVLREKIDDISEKISSLTNNYVKLSEEEEEYKNTVDDLLLRKNVFLLINRYFKINYLKL